MFSIWAPFGHVFNYCMFPFFSEPIDVVSSFPQFLPNYFTKKKGFSINVYQGYIFLQMKFPYSCIIMSDSFVNGYQLRNEKLLAP